MYRNQILVLTLCSLACVGYANTSATAGWFGPSNYDECVLNKMKGQGPYMLPRAQQTCRDQFPLPPAPPRPVRLNAKFIKYQLYGAADSNEISLRITDKPVGYASTKVVGNCADKSTCDVDNNSEYENFMINQFGPSDSNNWLHMSSKRTDTPDNFTFEHAVNQFYCYRLDFYGFVN